MILTHDEILNEIKNRRIQIDPFDESSIGPATVDLTLGRKLRVFSHGKEIVEFDYEKSTTPLEFDEYLLSPGELVLGITLERIKLPGDICGFLNSRSRFARLGLMSHISAPFISPGIDNHQVLEIYNAGPRPIKLIPGTKICHIVFAKCIGSATYTGIFKNQGL
ncbi:MAG: dCTP deaminase [Nanoarchaeota archaeon]|nr:dCTP deaminase [Nanoarchaeota archaeon]